MAEPTPKSRQIKAGVLLKYKTDVVLYSNATMISRRPSTSKTRAHDAIRMTTQTTLIIFGRQLGDVPKKPLLPPGYRLEQLLAIGLICDLRDGDDPLAPPRMSIVFHWFLTASTAELLDWIVAINAIIPANKQIFTDEELTMSLVMAEALHFNNIQAMHGQIAAAQAAHGEGSAVGDHAPSGAIEWTLSNAGAGGVLGGGASIMAADSALEAASGYDAFDATGGAAALDCADFDDCSAYASADAFAIF